MNLLIEAKSVLEKFGFQAQLAEISPESLLFEDDSLLGILSIHRGVNEIIEQWERLQDKFLKECAPQLRAEPQKAWNAYSVFLTQQKVSPNQNKQLVDLEEDIRGTRKIFGYGIEIPADIIRTLLPLLPVQSTTTLTREDYLQRLKKRIEIKELLSESNMDELFKQMMGSK